MTACSFSANETHQSATTMQAASYRQTGTNHLPVLTASIPKCLASKEYRSHMAHQSSSVLKTQCLCSKSAEIPTTTSPECRVQGIQPTWVPRMETVRGLPSLRDRKWASTPSGPCCTPFSVPKLCSTHIATLHEPMVHRSVWQHQGPWVVHFYMTHVNAGQSRDDVHRTKSHV